MGLVGPKARPKGVTDGQQVNIPALQRDRSRVTIDSPIGLCLHHFALVRIENAKLKMKNYQRNFPFIIINSQFSILNFRVRSGEDMSVGKDVFNLGAA